MRGEPEDQGEKPPAEPREVPGDETGAVQGPRVGTLCAVIAALTLVVFAPVADHEFVDLDDFAYVLWNPDVRVGSFSEAVAIAFTRPSAAGYVPLTTLSHQVDFLIHGGDATGPLIENVLLHVAATLLIFLALARMTGSRGASALVAAIFAVHPLHVESVAWASERKDVLSGALFGALLLAYARFVEKPLATSRYVLVVVLFALGLLAKPMLVTVPFVLLLLDYWPLGRLDREAVREKLPLFGLAAVAAVATISIQAAHGAMGFGRGISMARRTANAIDSYCAYLTDTFWPTNLAPFYPFPLGELSLAQIAAQAVLLAAVTAVVVALRRTRPYALTGWLWFGGMLVPVIGLVQVGIQARADRYMYLPLLGLAIAVVFGVADLAVGRVQRRVAAVVGAAAVLALAAVSADQVGVWRNSFTVYQRALEVSPGAAFPELRLGIVNAMIGEYDKAAAHLERAYQTNAAMGRDAVRQLDSMAAAHAEMNRFGAAADTAVLAIQVAQQTDQGDRVPELRKRLARYRSGRPLERAD